VKADPFARLMEITRDLEAAGIHYTVAKYRYDGVSLCATVPGERWEIDVLEDGTVDFERFVTSGGVTGADELRQFITRFSDSDAEAVE
jgi:hypothetical protein